MIISKTLIFSYNKLRNNNVNLKNFENFFGWVFDTFKRGKVTIDNLNFEIPNKGTTRQFRARFLTNAHEISERTMVKRYMLPSARVLELGGGLGIVSCLVNSMLEEPSNHVIVDPDTRSIATLKRNRALNNAHYQIMEGVVSAQKGQTLFRASNSISSSLHMGKAAERVPVTSLSIQEIIRETGINFDTLIIDIEGAELTFAQENRSYLNKTSLVIVELHPRRIGEGKCEEVRKILSGCGLHQIDVMNDVEAWCRLPLPHSKAA